MSNIHEFQVYVGNLSETTTDKMLYDHFKLKFSDVFNARVIRKTDGSSRGYGFVKYQTDESAIKSVGLLNGLFSPLEKLDGRELVVRETYRRSRSEAEQGVDQERSRTIFVGNLNLLLGDGELRKSFEKFGRVDSCRVILNRGFGFVTFEDNVAALAALSVMQNVEILNQRVYCTWGRPKDQPQDTYEEVTGRGLFGRKEEDLEDYNSSMMPMLSGLKRVREEPEADKKSRKEWLEEALEKSIITPLSGTAAEIQKEKNAIYIRKRMLEFIDEIKL